MSMSGTGAPKGNQYRKGKTSECRGRTIGLYILGNDLRHFEEMLQAAGKDHSQQAIDAYARHLFKIKAQEEYDEFLEKSKISTENP
jgi:hypothetical protein